MLCQLWRQCQKAIAFYHYKDIHKLKLGCTLPSLANIYLHKSTDAKFYPLTPGKKGLLEEIWDVVDCPFIVFTRKVLVEELFIRMSTSLCKSFVGIDAGQLYPYSMCQPMPTGLYTRWDLDSETSIFTPRQSRTRSLENMVMSSFQQTRPDCKSESFYPTGRQKKVNRLSNDAFCLHRNTVFEALGCFNHFCPCQELRPSLSEKISNVAVRKKNSMERDEAIYRTKVSLSLKCENVIGREFTRQPLMVNYLSEKTSPTDDQSQNTNS